MAAFTLRHNRWQSAGELRRAVTASWMLRGAPWVRAMAKAKCRGWARALEVTHGDANGWHPHIHAAFFLNDESAADKFGAWLFERWAAMVEELGFGECNPEIWRFERAAHYDAVVDYVVKRNYDMELTRGHMKLAKGGGRSPWQLLEDAGNGDKRAAALFRDFAAAFKGARQVTYSKGLRRAYELAEERGDDELAAEAIGEVIGFIPGPNFARIMLNGLGPAVLDAAEDGGWVAVVALLLPRGLYWAERPPASVPN
jgi:hypothetical protein